MEAPGIQPLIRRSLRFVQFAACKQTCLNLLYLLCAAGIGLAYSLTLIVTLSVSWGLIFPNIAVLAAFTLDGISWLKAAAVVLAGLLMAPLLVALLLLLVPLEQFLACALLAEQVPLERPLARFAWKRLVYVLAVIPVRSLAVLAALNLALYVVSLLGMPLVYLFGYYNLIIGPWRFDAPGKALLAGLIALLLTPLVLYLFNTLARISGWLARQFLSEP